MADVDNGPWGTGSTEPYPGCPCGDPDPTHSHNLPTADFIIKDSGKREEFAGGMLRDTTEGKIDYTLALDGPMFKRYAIHLTKGAAKYGKRNWLKAQGDEEYYRAKESALRHFLQWFWDERDEDHASAVFFNINECEYIREKHDPSPDFLR